MPGAVPDILVHVELPAQADLRNLWSQPAGTARIQTALTRLQLTAAQAQPAAIAAADAVVRAIDPAGSARVQGSLWIDDSLLLAVHADPARLAAAGLTAPALAARLGGALVDGSLIGPGDGTPSSAADPGVEAAQGTPLVQGWSADALGATAAHAAGLDGSGTTVGLLDAGVDIDHPALRAAFRGTQADGSVQYAGNAFDPWAAGNADGMPGGHDGPGGHGAERPGWGSSHGTWCAGMLVGAGTGVAPGARLITARTYGTAFTDGQSDAPERQAAQRWNDLRCLQWMLAPVGADGAAHAASAPQVISASWGEELGAIGIPQRRDLDVALQHVADAGIVSVFAAGNEGRSASTGTIAYPAMLDSVIAVGGIDPSRTVSPASSQGPSTTASHVKPDVVAPASTIRSTFPGGGWADTTGGPDGGFAGTSVAAPQVAGVLAIANQALAQRGAPPLDLRDARFLLARISDDLGAPGPDSASGWGLPDLRRLDDGIAALLAARAAGAVPA